MFAPVPRQESLAFVSFVCLQILVLLYVLTIRQFGSGANHLTGAEFLDRFVEEPFGVFSLLS